MPDLNLTTKVWHGRVFSDNALDWVAGKPTDPPDATFSVALTHYKYWRGISGTYAIGPSRNPNYFAAYDMRELLFGPRIDVRPCFDVTTDPTDILGSYDVFRLPSDREQWYYGVDVCDIGRGHSNEFRVVLAVPWYPWWDLPID